MSNLVASNKKLKTCPTKTLLEANSLWLHCRALSALFMISQWIHKKTHKRCRKNLQDLISQLLFHDCQTVNLNTPPLCQTEIPLSVTRLQREDNGLPAFSSRTGDTWEGFCLQVWWLSHQPLNQPKKIYSPYARSTWLSLKFKHFFNPLGVKLLQ